MMKVAIISHTEHYKRDGQLVGWGPTIREINHLARVFEEVWHLAVLRDTPAPPSALPYSAPNVRFLPLKPTGGKHWKDKLGTLLQAPHTVSQVRRALRRVDAFQLRLPTGFGVYMLPYLSLTTAKPGWIKYAGNWSQDRPPASYAFQRWWLKHLQGRKVTINGRWPGQSPKMLSFENPCLDGAERQLGRQVIEAKAYGLPLTACFVGRLDQPKGVGRILEALEALPQGRIERVHLIGDGPERSDFEARARSMKVDIQFHGFLPREEVAHYMQQSQLLLLPSKASEGFPKVIAEGWNYGCVPVVSDVSSIPQYVNAANGYVWEREGALSFARFFGQLDWSETELSQRARYGYNLAERFTFDYYNDRILTDILGRPRQRNGVPEHQKSV